MPLLSFLQSFAGHMFKKMYLNRTCLLLVVLLLFLTLSRVSTAFAAGVQGILAAKAPAEEVVKVDAAL